MEIRRAILKKFEAGSYRATIEVSGSAGGWLSAVPVARNIAAGDLLAGRQVALLLFDSSNPDDAVIFAVWAT